MKKPLTILLISLLLSGCSSIFQSSTSTDVGENIDYLATDWEDRSLFQSGLIESQQSVLDELPGVPIYHINLQIDKDLVKLSGEMGVRFTKLSEESRKTIESFVARNAPSMAFEKKLLDLFE